MRPIESGERSTGVLSMKRINFRRGQGGSVILEAMIAILIFSMGILALMGMQVAAVNTVTESKYRSDASFLANQIIGQMWANRAAIATYACAPCQSAASGNADTQGWVTEIQGGTLRLPGVTDAANQPTIALGANNQVTITIFWRAPNATAQRNHLVTAYVN